MAVSPDLTRLVAVGMDHIPSTSGTAESGAGQSQSQSSGRSGSTGDARSGRGSANAGAAANGQSTSYRMIVYDYATKQTQA